jgi:hypothetical protein
MPENSSPVCMCCICSVLKTSVLIFCPAHPLPTGAIWHCRCCGWRQFQLTSKPWPPSKTAGQKHGVCLAVHPSNLLSDKQVLNTWLVMFPQEFFIPSSQQNSEKTLFCICIAFHILGGCPLGTLCLLGLSGTASQTMSPAGQNPACTASRARSTSTATCCRSPSSSLKGSLLISTLTWWSLDSTVVVAKTFSRSLIAHPRGWKQFPFLKHLWRRVHMLYIFLV